MPIYEYTCRKCRREFEELVMGGREPMCPECQGKDLERKMSVTASPHGNVPASCAAGDMGMCPPREHRCGSGGCCHKK